VKKEANKQRGEIERKVIRKSYEIGKVGKNANE
jgi:hypothetical protein